MPRPRKKGLEYFPHDCNCLRDPKIQSLVGVHGAVGYAFYFQLLEIIYSEGGELDISDSEILHSVLRSLSVTCHLRLRNAQLLLNKCLAVDLLNLAEYNGNKVLTSNGIKRRCEPVNRKRLTGRKDKVGGVVSATETPKTELVSATETLQERTESKVKESKVKESKVKESKVKNLSTVKKIKLRFSPEGKIKYLQNVYLKEEEVKKLQEIYKAKGLEKEDLKEAIRIYNGWISKNEQARQFILSDFDKLQEWPLREVMALKTTELKLKAQKIFTEKAAGNGKLEREKTVAEVFAEMDDKIAKGEMYGIKN